MPGEGVESVAVDDLALRHGPPTLVKLDVEGAEVHALDGARRLLSESKPIVVCELHGAEARAQVPTLLAGYRLSELDSRDQIVARPHE